MLIHLNGMPGVGKLSVAHILAKRLSAHLVDNHALISAAHASGYPSGSKDLSRVLHTLNDFIYAELVKNHTLKHLVMTNALTNENASDVVRFADVEKLAHKRNEPFFPVLLNCDQEENCRRVIAHGRADKKKLTDPNTLRQIHQQYTMIHPLQHPNHITVDTTNLSPDQTVDIIVTQIQKLLPHQPPRHA